MLEFGVSVVDEKNPYLEEVLYSNLEKTSNLIVKDLSNFYELFE
jgi:hypothetical protein